MQEISRLRGILVSSQIDRPATADILHRHVNKADLATFDRLAESKEQAQVENDGMTLRSKSFETGPWR
jgi:hypothetical protein